LGVYSASILHITITFSKVVIRPIVWEKEEASLHVAIVNHVCLLQSDV